MNSSVLRDDKISASILNDWIRSQEKDGKDVLF